MDSETVGKLRADLAFAERYNSDGRESAVVTTQAAVRGVLFELERLGSKKMSKHAQRLLKAAHVAASFRSIYGPNDAPESGYVLLWKGEAVGWTRDLSSPGKNRPGVLAIGVLGINGPIYLSTGGNYSDGAAEWSAVWNPAAPGSNNGERALP